MKSQALLLPLLFIYCTCFSQDYGGESLLYSRTDLLGTARTAGAGGAFGSVGADLGSLDINPAGIGLYHSGDISITPGLRFTNNQSSFYTFNPITGNAYSSNNTGSGQVPIAFLSQAGIEWTWQMKEATRQTTGFTPQSGLLKSLSLALNYTHTNIYARSQNFTNNGVPSGLSFLDYTVIAANYSGVSAGNLQQYAAPYPEMAYLFNVNLFGFNSTKNIFVNNTAGPYNQIGSIETRGGIDKIAMTFGGNVDDKVFFGFSLDMPILRYDNSPTITESYAGDSASIFQNYSISSEQTVTGGGVTGSLGLIYRPAKWIRIGAAYHLPTWYWLTEVYSVNNFIANFDTATNYNNIQFPLSSQTNYSFMTPMKGTFSASFYLKEFGFLSIDYQIENYGAARFHSSASYFDAPDLDDSIKAWYGFSHTVHAGFEAAIKLIRLRAGYAISTSPVKSSGTYYESGYNSLQQNVTAGIGMRLKRFYFDFAYVYGITKDYSLPFYANMVSNNKFSTNTLLLTIGWKLQPKSSSSSRKRPQPQQPTYNNNNYHDYRDGY